MFFKEQNSNSRPQFLETLPPSTPRTQTKYKALNQKKSDYEFLKAFNKCNGKFFQDLTAEKLRGVRQQKIIEHQKLVILSLQEQLLKVKDNNSHNEEDEVNTEL